MNKEKFLDQLSEHLCDMIVHKSLLPELVAIMKNSGSEKQFLKIFSKRLDFLREHGVNAVQLSKDFERLDSNICSLHADLRDKNVRVLYSICADGTILLLGFHERAGKQNTDYTQKTPEALRRLHEMED